MKSFLALLIICCFYFGSCSRCYECTADLPIYFNDSIIGTTPHSEEFCGYDARVKATALEEEPETDYECEKQ